ncbi:MAG: sigma-54-dependent Fis family transcriptional regulator [Janthinobacterium lividum]
MADSHGVNAPFHDMANFLQPDHPAEQHADLLVAASHTQAQAHPGQGTIGMAAPTGHNPGGQGRPARQRGPTLQQLDTGDPLMRRALDQVARVAGRDIAILITGETGTGKELLAQAIYHDCARAGAPFCAVNCAAIPETLIESELFGYDEGAFTGARRKGSRGKILQAHGGILFLDEIGDMPPSLQARLLRVLQEREVTPLGSQRAIAIDVVLVCATNRNLRSLITQQLFREDLYYRLNGLVVKLPPLRQRSDIDTLVERMLAGQHDPAGKPSRTPARPGQQQGYTVSAPVMALLRQHPWPGNLRQLANLLRTACAMTGEDGDIGIEHLPEDFLEDLAGLAVGDNTLDHDNRRGNGTDAACLRLHGSGAAADSGTGTGIERCSGSGNERGSDARAAAPPMLKMDETRAQLIENALARFEGNISATARALGISRNTVYRQRAATDTHAKAWR